VNDQLVFQLVKASYRTYLNAVGELACFAFTGDNMSHILSHGDRDSEDNPVLWPKLQSSNKAL
jgi:hypothetical protein